MATSNVVISEGQITFKRVQGHKHDGILSTLIDTSKYSIFDFIVAENATDSSRASSQANRKEMFKSFIISTVEDRVLKPTGIALQANSITAREIVSGTITADQLSSNIILVNNVIKSSNYINNTGTYSGWAIFSNGTANFNNVNIRGNIYLSSTGGMSYNSSSTAFFANSAGYFSLKDKLTWDGSNLTITGNATISGTVTIAGTAAQQIATKSALGGSALQPGDAAADVNTYNTVISGDKIRTGSISSQNGINVINLSAGTINFGSGNFTVDGSGNVVVAGTITATDGYIGGLDIATTYIQSTDYIANPTTAGFRINSDGTAVFNEVTVRGSISASTISGSTLTTGTWSAAGATGLKLDSDGYITGAGGGVKIRNFGTNGTDGATGTLLFGDVISSPTVRGDKLEVVSRFTAADIGVTISPTLGNTPLELERNYATTANFIRFRNTSNSTYPGAIEFNGTNGLTYKITSDKRLKENIEEIINACSIVKKLSPVEFNFISDGPSLKMHGFLAQDMYEVYTYPVSVGSDDVEENPWGIDYGKITPLLTAALKEALERIESLEARIQTLEGV
jgi:hypothetical protein